MLAEFALPIFYTQVLVHGASHPSPGLIWTDEHVAQGFAWSDGLVSLGVPDHDGECAIRVSVDTSPAVSDGAVWSIKVPFAVREQLMIGTVGLLTPIDVPIGDYALIYEAVPPAEREPYAYRLLLRFVPDDAADFAILHQGDELEVGEVLLRNADLAVPVD